MILASRDNIDEHKNIVINTLTGLGWTLNWEKCSLQVSQEKEYLGFVLNTVGNPTLRVPISRIRKVRKDIARLVKSGQATARVVARVCGQCVSMFKAIAPGKLMLRNAYKCLASRSSWDSIIVLDAPAVKDLMWWHDAVIGWNGSVITPKPTDVQIHTDASHIGYGAVCQGVRAAGFWSPKISNMPSNNREMWAVLMAIHTFGPRLRGKAVRVVTDNISTMAYINKMGGTSSQLTAIAKDIFMACHKFDIVLTASFLAGCRNVEADWRSRLPELYEWQLNPRLFHHIDAMWDPHSVDRFATMTNCQLEQYNSRFWDPMTEGVDALSLPWPGENNFINPPFRLLSQIIDKIVQEKVHATVIAPKWIAQPWFQKLQHILVSPPLRIPNKEGSFLSSVRRPEPLRNWRWQVYAYRVYGGIICPARAGRIELQNNSLCA